MGGRVGCGGCRVSYNMFFHLPSTVANDPQVVARARMISNVYMVLTGMVLMGIFVWNAFQETTTLVTVSPVSESDFLTLKARHADLECPCTNVLQPYGNIAEVSYDFDDLCEKAVPLVKIIEDTLDTPVDRYRGKMWTSFGTEIKYTCEVARSFIVDQMASLDSAMYGSLSAQEPSVIASSAKTHYLQGLQMVRREFMRLLEFQTQRDMTKIPLTLHALDFHDLTIAAFEEDYPEELVYFTDPATGHVSAAPQWTFPEPRPGVKSFMDPNSPSYDRFASPRGIKDSRVKLPGSNHTIGRVVIPHVPVLSQFWEAIRRYNGSCDCTTDYSCQVTFCDTKVDYVEPLKVVMTMLGEPEMACALPIQCSIQDMLSTWPTSGMATGPMWTAMHGAVVLGLYPQDYFFNGSKSWEFGERVANLNLVSNFATIGDGQRNLFIADDKYYIHPTYSKYFERCAPAQCSYIDTSAPSLLEVAQSLSAFAGGIAVIGKFIATCVFHSWLSSNPHKLRPATRRWTRAHFESAIIKYAAEIGLDGDDGSDGETAKAETAGHDDAELAKLRSQRMERVGKLKSPMK